MEGEGAARETGGACLTVPVQTSGAPGQPEEPDTIHQTSQDPVFGSRQGAARSPKQVIRLIFWG